MSLSPEEKRRRQKVFMDVFHSHFWGNRNNSGKNYVRPYSLTHSSAKEYMNSRKVNKPEVKVRPLI